MRVSNFYVVSNAMRTLPFPFASLVADTTEYLVADQCESLASSESRWSLAFCQSNPHVCQPCTALDCSSNAHFLAQLYAILMILVYPVGIPTLYASLLMKDRKLLKVDRLRTKKTRLLKTAFLWDEYVDKFWWFGESSQGARRGAEKARLCGSRCSVPIHPYVTLLPPAPSPLLTLMTQHPV